MSRISVCFALVFTLTLVTGFDNAARAKDALVLNTTVSIPLSTEEGTGISDLRLYEVFRRMKTDIKIRYLPAERALINADMGIDDGTFLRIAGLSSSYPNLVAVPESFMDFEFVAIGKDDKFVPSGWDSLTPYDLGIITGWKVVEDNTKNAKSVTKANNVEQLFKLLEFNRVDIIIYEKLRALFALQENPVEGAVIMEPPLVRKPMFLYMNTKHIDLIPEIAVALRASKADGTHDRLQEQALQQFQTPK